MNVLNFNQVILVGNLTAAPELMSTPQGTPYCRFRIASNRRHLSADGQRATDFIDCVTWRQQAEFLVTHFRMGSPVMVIGELQSNKFADKKGNVRYTIEVSVKDVRMVEAPNVASKPTLPCAEEPEMPSEPPF